ncbi:hypothetical protein KIH74_03365 [Kineosporia sp. J2-2]|uniref:GH26 domain-containing protein n=1 Tax=Kineosporia corallincola TaxID=2835133 RepID=A0ABS5TA70_9ACTN|nr:glycosyl hydrolase [Kineosporia corallincola]MBT0767946.1 hypothetical protein [Kineosporia corallincola]
MLDTRRSRATRATTDSARMDPALARRKRRTAAGARVGAAGGSSFFSDETPEAAASGVRIEPARPQPRLTRSELRARRERMEKRRRRRAIQRQLTFGLIGRETDPQAKTEAIPELRETQTGSIRVRSGQTGAIRKPELAPEPSLLEVDVTADDPTPTGGISRREIRGKRPKTGRRSGGRSPIGRAVSNKRAWLGAVAITLVLAVPGYLYLDRTRGTTEEAALTSDSNEMPAQTATRSASPTSEELVEAQKRLGKATATAKKLATTKSKKATKSSSSSSSTTKDSTPSSSTSTGGTTQIGLANLSDSASGLGWASGLYMPGSSASNAAAFGKWRGAGIDVVVDWPARSSWDDLIDPDWLYDSWEGTSYTKSFGFPPFPENSGGSLSQCAAGSYNSKWKQIAQNIKDAGLDDTTVIRLGWEFNGDWYEWAAGDADNFAECWRQVVSAAESVAPALTWDWNVNRGVSAGLADPTKAYPGDKYVDIVGIDSYDMWPGATSEANWDEQLNGKQGLKYWVNFAKSHGKKVSVPEWGVYPGTAQAGHNGGDNAYYIGKMKSFFESLGSQLAYEAYFNEDASYYAGSIFGNVQNPEAAAKYKSIYSK